MNLIEESGIDDGEQRQYAKIIRAHLRESELFLIRYNGMIEYGNNFIEYVNKYKLLKHLPIMSLMEMKYFNQKIISRNRSPLPLNLLIHHCWQTIYHRTVDKAKYNNSQLIVLEDYHKYNLSIDLSDERKSTIKLTINQNSSNKILKFVPFHAFSTSDFELFLKFTLQEIYNYSNFEIFNSNEKLIFAANSTTTTSTIVIEASVKSTIPLFLSYNDWKKSSIIKRPTTD